MGRSPYETRSARQTLARIADRFIDRHFTRSYSQEGEDILLARVFGRRTTGFYVDVGAHDPRRFSNTYLFYRRGWSGINIEPNPDAIRRFRRLRPRDQNLEMGIGETEATLNYHAFDEPALNTFSSDLAQQRLATTSYKLLGTQGIPVRRLDSVLNSHLREDQAIDFLTIDTEGLDLSVLKSNDWSRFRPILVLAEALETSLDEVQGAEIVLYMRENGYIPFAKTLNTLVFRNTRS